MAVYSYPIVTGITAAFLGLLHVFLGGYVIAGRQKNSVSLGDGGNYELNQRIRMHGNLTENAPIFLVLLALVELTGVHPLIVGCLGPAFVVCRIAQAIGLSPAQPRGPNAFRFIGTSGTFVCQIILAIALLVTLAPHLGSW